MISRSIEAVADGLGRSIGWLAEHGVLFAVFATLWAGLAIGLLVGGTTVDQVWMAIAQLPLIAQLVLWLLFLPVMAGMWVWATDWPLLVRLLLVFGLAVWNLLVLLPRRSAQTATQ